MFWTALLLLFAALCLLTLELFLPTAGSLGILSAALIIASIVCGFLTNLQTGLLILFLVMLALPAIFYLVLKVWPHTPIGRRILTDEKTLTDILPQGEYYDRTENLVGKIGIAKTKMLPSGQILIDGVKYDAISDGFAVAAGDTVQVISIKQNRIYVQPAVPHAASGAPDNDSPLARPVSDLGIEADDIDDLLS